MRTALTFWRRCPASASTSATIMYRPNEINWVRVLLQFALALILLGNILAPLVASAQNLGTSPQFGHPYASYEHLAMNIPVRTEGDAHARAQVRMEEINTSISLVLQALKNMPEGAVETKLSAPSGAEGLGWCEGPRGSIYYCVHFDGADKLARVKVKSASFSNWRVFPFTVHDTNMMDYAINEASFGLTMAGCDR